MRFKWWLSLILLLSGCDIANAQPAPTPVINKAAQIKTVTSGFNNNLSGADTDVQKALDTIDNLTISGGGATQLSDLSDVDFSTPPVDGKIFIYSDVPNYSASLSPLRWNGNDYKNANLGVCSGNNCFIFLSTSSPQGVEADGTTINTESSTSNLNMALIDLPGGNGKSTFLFTDAVATNAGDLLTILQGQVDPSATVDNFKANYFTYHAGSSYTFNGFTGFDNGGTVSVVSGDTTPPTLTVVPGLQKWIPGDAPNNSGWELNGGHHVVLQNGVGNVGIGTTGDPQSLLDVAGDAHISGVVGIGGTTPDPSVGVGVKMSVDNTSGTKSALHADIINTPTSDTTSEVTAGLAFTATASGSHQQGLIYGISGTTFYNGTANLLQAQGGSFIVKNESSGSISAGYGANYATIINGTGDITNYLAAQIAPPVYNSSGRITGASLGLYIWNMGHAGTANSVGIYIKDQSGSSGLNGALVTEGGAVELNTLKTSAGDLIVSGDNDDNLLVTKAALDNVGIGTSAPNAKLQVVGDVFIDKTSGKLIMRSPDASCSACGPDNSDVWACASVTCP